MTKIKLKIIGSVKEREFAKVHALKILRLENSCYELPSDSPFEIVKNDFKRKPNKRADKKTTSK
jgi:hypothetical protein|tara:strand:+ start:720 stop:911 length:192 start_codon:yes stop_codon:yes gene_type:complete